jgi:hypothetical protein
MEHVRVQIQERRVLQRQCFPPTMRTRRRNPRPRVNKNTGLVHQLTPIHIPKAFRLFRNEVAEISWLWQAMPCGSPSLRDTLALPPEDVAPSLALPAPQGRSEVAANSASPYIQPGTQDLV